MNDLIAVARALYVVEEPPTRSTELRRRLGRDARRVESRRWIGEERQLDLLRTQAVVRHAV